MFATAPLAEGRVFVVEKGGLIKSVMGGVTSNFLSVAVNQNGEQGLLGLAFDPQYGMVGSAGQGCFFVNYTDPGNGDSVIASYRATAGVANPASRVEVLRFDQPDGLENHKAGWLSFKPGDNNHLYIATGNGSGGNDPSNFAQNRNVLLGKMLRVNINADDFADPNINCGVPGDNPFVGQGAREELNPIRGNSGGGQNFGWRLREGDIATPGVGGPRPADNVDPVLVCGRSVGQSITGGTVVRDPTSPLNGHCVFGDFVFGKLWALPADAADLSFARAIDITAVLDAGAAGALGNISSFGSGPAGELYVVDYGGKVVQVVPEPATAAMLLGGMAGLLGWCRQQRRQQQA